MPWGASSAARANVLPRSTLDDLQKKATGSSERRDDSKLKDPPRSEGSNFNLRVPAATHRGGRSGIFERDASQPD